MPHHVHIALHFKERKWATEAAGESGKRKSTRLSSWNSIPISEISCKWSNRCIDELLPEHAHSGLISSLPSENLTDWWINLEAWPTLVKEPRRVIGWSNSCWKRIDLSINRGRVQLRPRQSLAHVPKLHKFHWQSIQKGRATSDQKDQQTDRLQSSEDE